MKPAPEMTAPALSGGAARDGRCEEIVVRAVGAAGSPCARLADEIGRSVAVFIDRSSIGLILKHAAGQTITTRAGKQGEQERERESKRERESEIESTIKQIV